MLVIQLRTSLPDSGPEKWKCHFAANALGPKSICVEFLSWRICQVMYKLQEMFKHYEKESE